jgi:biopolymer transport protein ExbD
MSAFDPKQTFGRCRFSTPFALVTTAFYTVKVRIAFALPIILVAVASGAEAREPRPLWVELYQSGTIVVANQQVTLRRLARQLRSAGRDADLLCVWREQKAPNGRPAFNIYDQADMKRFEIVLRVEATIVETARSSDLPVFQDGDPECSTTGVRRAVN